MKNLNFYIMFVIALMVAPTLNAQQITTNETGEKIIVFPDGSWRYAEDADIEKMTKRGTPDAEVVAEEVYTDEDLKIAIQIAEIAAAEETNAVRIAEEAQYEKLVIEDELKEAEASGDYFDDEIQEIKDRLKKAKKAEKKAKSNLKKASKKAKAASKMMAMNAEERLKALQKYELYHTLKNEARLAEQNAVGMFPDEMPAREVDDVEKVIASESKKVNTKKPVPVFHTNVQSNASFAKYNREKDVLLNPPSVECQLTFDGIDEFSGKKRKDVAKQLLFTYTNEELRSVYKDQDYITCTGYVSSLSGGLKFLTLNITIASKTAQREYGILEKGGTINVKLLNGDNVKMGNTKTNMGIENPLDGSVSYRAQYLISSGDEKKLKNSEVDKLRIVWSSGYEDYEIYEMDFFLDQFKCLEGK